MKTFFLWRALAIILCGFLLHLPSCRAQGDEALANKPNIGVGLEGLADWSRAKMFADAMKTARAWGNAERPWEHTVKTDAQGWPEEDAGVIVMADTPNISGTYRLSFNGKANVRGHFDVKIENLQHDAAINTSTALVHVPNGANQLFLSFTNTAGGVKNVQLWRPGSIGEETFTKAFLEKLQPFSTLRFMDFQATNNNPTKRWSDRTTPQHASQVREQGGALEYIIELANVSGKDIWINVPDQADDDYIRQMATLLKNGLTKNQKVYVEWSNEVWNWQFQQATRNLESAKIEGKQPNSPLAFDKDNNEGYWAMRRIAQRSVEVGQIFRDVFNDQNFERVRPIYATQVGYEEVFKQGLSYLEHQYQQPNKALYAIAGAPYFQVSDELNQKKDLTVDEIFNAIPASIEQSLDWSKTLAAYANYYNLKVMAYEGGQHLQDHGDVGNADAKVAANRDPRMGQAIEQYLRGWNALGGDLFMYFTLTSSYSKWGSWGLVDDVNQSSPKYEAVLQALNEPPTPLTLGTSVGEEIQAGDFLGTNRWDKKGAPEITIEPEKWMQYVVRAPKAGTYTLTAQVSAGQLSRAQILINNQDGGALNVANNARTSNPATIQLKEGINVIRIQGQEGRFNLTSLHVE